MHPAVAATMFLTGIFTVAIVAEILSQKAQTVGVLGAAGTALSNVINAATSPITQSTGLGNAIQSTQPTGPNQIVAP